MKQNEKKEIITKAHDTINKVSDTLNVDGNKAKDYISHLNESDLKVIRELENLIDMFNKPLWKVAIGIILVCSVINACYILGSSIGSLIANLGL